MTGVLAVLFTVHVQCSSIRIVAPNDVAVGDLGVFDLYAMALIESDSAAKASGRPDERPRTWMNIAIQVDGAVRDGRVADGALTGQSKVDASTPATGE